MEDQSPASPLGRRASWRGAQPPAGRIRYRGHCSLPPGMVARGPMWGQPPSGAIPGSARWPTVRPAGSPWPAWEAQPRPCGSGPQPTAVRGGSSAPCRWTPATASQTSSDREPDTCSRSRAIDPLTPPPRAGTRWTARRGPRASCPPEQPRRRVRSSGRALATTRGPMPTIPDRTRRLPIRRTAPAGWPSNLRRPSEEDGWWPSATGCWRSTRVR